jgi:hypothetical protein
MPVRVRSHIAVLFSAILLALHSSPEAAKYAGEPFHIGVGARALGMGGAFAAVADDVTSGFWNPAGLSVLRGKQAILMHSEMFGSLLNHDYIAFACPLRSALGSAVGAVSLTRLGGGGIKLTRWDPNLNRVVVDKESGHADYQLVLSYGMSKSERLRIGASAKLLYRDIADNSAFGIGADLGAQFDVSNYATVALMIRDATTTLLSYDDSSRTKESVFPTIIPGIAVSRTVREFTVTVSADAELKFEHYQEAAQFWMGSASADTRFGLEIGFQNVAFGRIGSDLGRLTLGSGIAVSMVELDIAYMRQAEIDNSFRISLLYKIR